MRLHSVGENNKFSGSLAPLRRRISGLVAEYIVAIDVTRVRFPADALFRYGFCTPTSNLV